jgi:hypothetical protein
VYVSAAVYLLVFLALYVEGIVDFSRMILAAIVIALGLVFFVVAQKMRKTKGKWSPKRQMLGGEIAMIAFGALVGMVAFIFGGALLLFGFQTLLQWFGFRFVLPPFALWYIVSSVVGAIVGGYIAYWRNRTRQIFQS